MKAILPIYEATRKDFGHRPVTRGIVAHKSVKFFGNNALTIGHTVAPVARCRAATRSASSQVTPKRKTKFIRTSPLTDTDRGGSMKRLLPLPIMFLMIG